MKTLMNEDNPKNKDDLKNEEIKTPCTYYLSSFFFVYVNSDINPFYIGGFNKPND